jgi:hypothetical protein
LRSQIARVESFIGSKSKPEVDAPPILIFNASTRIHRLSLNAAYSLLTGWALRARGYPVRYLVCQHGMGQCILGARPAQPSVSPPCRSCIRLSESLFPKHLTIPIELAPENFATIQDELKDTSVAMMMDWTHGGIAFGQVVLPGLRWVLRRHHLEDSDATRTFFRQFLASAVSLNHRFHRIIERLQPQAVVLFNGIFFPEAVLREAARREGISAATHEVGLRPFSAFFSHQEATFRQLDIEERADLTQEEQNDLERYLESRFRGDFSMAGVRFWETMRDPPTAMQAKLDAFSSYIPVFTNVIFDTSQIHANTIFPDMFEWLDGLKSVITNHEDTLFILRAHPDEDRPGKASRESVTDWFRQSGLGERANVVFIPPDEEVNSYRLIEGARLVLVYNSSIGLEASILGKPVLCAGRARYTKAETVFFPETKKTYWTELEQLLTNAEIDVPASYSRNARRFLYDELFRASLDLSDFLQEDPTLPGMVTLKAFDPVDLLKSPALRTICQGITEETPFLLDA